MKITVITSLLFNFKLIEKSADINGIRSPWNLVLVHKPLLFLKVEHFYGSLGSRPQQGGRGSPTKNVEFVVLVSHSGGMTGEIHIWQQGPLVKVGIIVFSCLQRTRRAEKVVPKAAHDKDFTVGHCHTRIATSLAHRVQLGPDLLDGIEDLQERGVATVLHAPDGENEVVEDLEVDLRASEVHLRDGHPT